MAYFTPSVALLRIVDGVHCLVKTRGEEGAGGRTRLLRWLSLELWPLNTGNSNDQIDFVDYVVNMTRGKPQLRLFDNVIRQSFRGQFRKWVSEFLGTQVSTSISRKMFRCNRARAITNLVQLIGFLSGKDENKIGLMKGMGFGEEEKIRELADFLFGNILKVKSPLLAYNSFVEAIYVLNDCNAHTGQSNFGDSQKENRLYCIREDVVNSLAYEADARLEDPIYGCELATYMGPSTMMPNVTQALIQQYVNMQPMLGQMGGIRPVRTTLSGPTLKGQVSVAY
nr:condensin-2 complex subunit D3 [Tanacetum cinerariifolium]